VEPILWPATEDELVSLQVRLAEQAAGVLARDRWTLPPDLLVGGCFVAFARGEAGPGQAGDRAWAAAVVWRPASAPVRRRDGAPYRRIDRALVGSERQETPRQAVDVLAQAVVAGRVPAAYSAGLLALREGPILAAAVAHLDPAPDVLLVDATGLDHPRRAGLAVHLGAVTGIATVGVTQRTLCARGDPPGRRRRGESSAVVLEGDVVGYWVCTRTGAKPVLAHAGWRTDSATAGAVVLAASTEGARAPVPLQEARRAAREARDLAGAGTP
jgi:deoxyribonuclease V